ncbi:MAG: dUTP diphosphatase [Spirochaetes bacterium]|nr:dUTP diphosphatase [Spirochaetota bacterium]
MVLKIYRISKKNLLPCYMTEDASGIDLMASLESPVEVKPGEFTRISTGIIVSIPRGYEAQIRPRSGLAFKHGVTVLNAPGTIDADYRGEVDIILINHGKESFTVTNGMRIAQMVIARVANARIEEVVSIEELEKTERDNGGFGHTGE